VYITSHTSLIHVKYPHKSELMLQP